MRRALYFAVKLWKISLTVNVLCDISVLSYIVHLEERRKYMISINYRDSRPIYEQIADSLRVQIAKQLLEPDEKLPSVREIASELSINPNTIQRAIRQLEQEGYVYSVSGRGTFVAQMNNEDSPRRLELLQKFDHLVKELSVYNVSENELIERMKKSLEGGVH